MGSVFGYQTALDCWQAFGQDDALANMRPSRSTHIACDYKREELLAYATDRLHLPSAPLHVLVPDAAQRKNTAQIICHVHSGPLQPGSLYLIDEQRLVASPELCFMQMASCLPLLKTIELGIELCGTYQPSASEAGAIAQRREPITTPKKLSRYIQAQRYTRGMRNAKDALPWIRQGSASPMETFLWMRLCLPIRLGGRGLEAAEFNHTVELNAKGRNATGKRTLRCDLFFPSSRIAIEYDSTQYHSQDERLASDSVRRGALEGQGIRVVTITRREFFSYNEFEAKLRQIAQLANIRLRKPDSMQMQKRQTLRDTLLSPGLMNYRI